MKTTPQTSYIKFDVKLPNNKIVTITIPLVVPAVPV
jgi:hypothetical protein